MRITKPQSHEPIRLVEVRNGRPVYRVVIDTAPKGAPRRQVTRTFGSLREARGLVSARDPGARQERPVHRPQQGHPA